MASKNSRYFMVTHTGRNGTTRNRRRMLSSAEVAHIIKSLLDNGVNYISITAPQEETSDTGAHGGDPAVGLDAAQPDDRSGDRLHS
jgi:hypothetical protein